MLPSDPSLYYETVGERGPLVVVLHGGPGLPHDYLRPEWDRLAEGARVVYYDQRGCGRSGRTPPYGWRAHVLDLDRLLAALSPDEPVVLAGSSWGPMLALYYSVAHPARVRALVLSGVTQAVKFGGKRLDPGFLARFPVARWDAVNRGLLPENPDLVVPSTMMDPDATRGCGSTVDADKCTLRCRDRAELAGRSRVSPSSRPSVCPRWFSGAGTGATSQWTPGEA